jgi:hypothetical protein
MGLLEKPPTLENAMPKKPLTVTVNRRASSFAWSER